MPAKLDITEAIIDRYIEIRSADSGLRGFQQLQAEFPDIFGGKAHSLIINLMSSRLQARGVETDFRKQQRTATPPANQTFPRELPELIVEFSDHCMVVGDMHAPIHSVATIDRAIQVADAREIDTLFANGDWFDHAHSGFKGTRSVRAAPFVEGLHKGAEILLNFAMSGRVRRVIVDQGNHDDKPIRNGDQELTFEEWWRAKVWPLIEHDWPAKVDLQITSRYYAIMKPRRPQTWPFAGPDAFPWRISHQKNYGVNQLSVAARLADVHMSNMVCGHQHHLAVGKHKSRFRMSVAEASM